MAILWSRTNCFASASRNVACPSRSGQRDNKRIVSSGVFLSVLRCAQDMVAKVDEQDQDAADTDTERRSAGRRKDERREAVILRRCGV